MSNLAGDGSVSARLLNGALWIGFGKVTTNILGIISTFVLARLLSPSDFGLVAIAVSFVGLVSIVSELSLSAALVHLSKVTDGHLDTAWTFNVIRGVILSTLIVIGSGLLSSIYGQEELQSLLSALAISVMIGSMYNPKMILLNKRLIFWQESVVSIAGKAVSFIVSVSIAYIYQSYWALIWGMVASQAISTLMSYIFMPYRPRLSVSLYRDLFGFSLWITLGRIAQSISWRSDPLILGVFMPVASLGFINVGQRISHLIINEIMQPIGQVLFPAFATMQDDLERLRRAYLRSTGMMCLISFPIGVGIALAAEPFVLTFLGEKWLPAAPVLQVWVLFNAWGTIQRVQPLAMAVGETKALFYRDIRILGVRVPLVLAGVWLGFETGFGAIYGVLWGHMASAVINTTWNMQLVKKISKASLIDQHKVALSPYLGASAMAVALVALDSWFIRSDIVTNSWLVLLANVAVGSVTYLLSVLLFWLVRGRPDGTEVEFTNLFLTTAKRFGFGRI